MPRSFICQIYQMAAYDVNRFSNSRLPLIVQRREEKGGGGQQKQWASQDHSVQCQKGRRSLTGQVANDMIESWERPPFWATMPGDDGEMIGEVPWTVLTFCI